jgi:flagellar basal body P-ring formation protein FlgA
MRFYFKMYRSAIALSAIALAAVTPAWSAAELHSLVEIENLARAEAQRDLPPLKPGENLNVGPIDARLRLSKCSAPIRARPGAAQRSRAGLLIEVRCDQAPGWALYVPVRVTGVAPVVVATRALNAGHALLAQDLALVRRDLALLPAGYIEDVSSAIGLAPNRPIAAGALLTTQLLSADKAVSRGEGVTLIARGPNISVQSQGRALSDGLINQRVRIQNASSGRIVEGIALARGVVQISLP